MTLYVSEEEVKDAVCQWLKARGISTTPEDLKPVVQSEVEGEYEDRTVTNTTTGYKFEFKPKN
jgi:hypothetical protein